MSFRKVLIKMLAYKFRSADQFGLALDILINNRLYCSDWSLLNDPMEGAFAYSYRSTDESDYSAVVDEIIRTKRQLLVCSLSRTFDCHLLWAHYASGFRGMAIELDLPDDDPRIRVIEYRGVFAYTSFPHPVDAERDATLILSSKYREWEYEQELRIIQNAKWYDVQGRVRRVIAGHRMEPAVFEALRIICENKDIVLARTGIGDEGIDADLIRPLASNHAPNQPRRPRRAGKPRLERR